MLTDILQRQRKSGYSGFAGASVKGRVPIRENLINDLVQQAMQQRPSGRLTVHRVLVGANNIVTVNLTVKKWLFSQTLNLEIAVDPIIDVPRDPNFRARPARSLGVLGLLIEIFSAAFPLPTYASFANQTFSLNLKAALESNGYPDVAPLLQYVGITTEPGVLNIDFRLAVPPSLQPVTL